MWARLAKRAKQPGWLAVTANESQVDYVHSFPSERGGPTFGLAGSRSLGAGDTFERVARELRFETFRCTTTLQPGEYQVLMIDGLNVPDEELKGALRWRVKDMLDYPVENATIDVLGIPADEATQKLKGRALFAVAARNEAIKSCMERFEQARVPLGVIDIAEAAQRNIAALFETGNRAVALLYLAKDWGLLTVNNKRELMMARRLEVGYTLLADGEASLESPVERLALELQRSFDHFERQFSGLSIEKVLMAPMPIPGSVASQLSGSLGLPVLDLDLAAVATLEGDLATPEAQWRLFHLIGAALRDEKPL